MEQKQVWELINDSAKTRFNYAEFEEVFSDIDDEIPDEVLFKLITLFHEGESDELIAEYILNYLLTLNLNWDESEIGNFILGKREILAKEILAFNIALDMLEQGAEPSIVYVNIERLLN